MPSLINKQYQSLIFYGIITNSFCLVMAYLSDNIDENYKLTLLLV